MRNAAASPGNLLGNANTLKQAANAALQSRTSAALQAAARRIESGAARTVRINPYMTLYNANKIRLDRHRFLVASARSQSGNALGLAGGAITAGTTAYVAAAIAGVSLASAPLIIIGLIGGIAIQAVWGAFGGADWAEKQARRALER